MAVFDYYGIAEQIKTVLDADASINAIVEIDKLPTFDPMASDGIYIYLESRSAPARNQRIRAGTSTDFEVTVSIWCFAFHSDDVSIASNHRDDLMGLVELALMGNRSLNDKVHTLWIEGGKFYSETSNGFWSGGEVRITATGQATV